MKQKCTQHEVTLEGQEVISFALDVLFGSKRGRKLDEHKHTHAMHVLTLNG